MEETQGTPSVRFASFELDVRSRELRRGDTCIRLQEQPFEILRLMLERPGDVVTREEMQQRLWPDGTFVDFEHSLNAAVKRLRAALGDNADHPQFVETLPRRGYRFIARLEDEDRQTAKAGPADPAAGAIRLAVLPFSNLSDDSTQEYFSDGMTEELIAQLGPLCRGRISVIARRSSMAFKGSLQRASEIADVLRAAYLLEGSVRRDGRRVRITVRLIEGATEAELWSDTHDRTEDDWLSVQADVAAHVARSLMVELSPARAHDVPNPRAHQAYLKARFHWGRPGDEGYDQAIGYLAEAIATAPDYAPAHGLLARVQVGAAEYYREIPTAALATARQAAQRALELDPTNGEAQVVTADVDRMVDFDWRRAQAGYRAALAANPSSELAHRGHAFLLAVQGRHADAMRAAELARELDPLCLVPSLAVGWTRYAAGRFAEAIAECQHTIDMGPSYVPAWRLLAAAQLQVGDTAAAVASLRQVRTSAGEHPQVLAWLAHALGVAGDRDEAVGLIGALRENRSHYAYVSPYHLALAFVGINSLDAAFESLAQAFVDRDPMIAHIVIEPRFDVLRGDARYQRLLQRMRLA
jgi:TolB-like protein/Flp pilus assembly protein TadD